MPHGLPHRVQAGVSPRFRRVARAGLAAGLSLAFIATASSPALADQVRRDEWWLSTLHVTNAWETTGGSGVRVAVLDTGVNPAQADLTGSVTTGPDYTNSGRTAAGLYWGIHGTEVASLIAGHGHGPGHANGIIGIAPEAKILSVRVTLESNDPLLSDQAIASGLPGAIARGIRWAVRHGAGVIDLPLDPVTTAGAPGSGGSAAEHAAIRYALAKHVVLVAPAGDGGAGTDPVNYPAAYHGVISVGAFDQNFVKAPFTSHRGYVTVTAAGAGVTAAGPSGTYLQLNSTSGASAIVAGVAALVRAQFPAMTPAQVTRAITTGTVYRPSGGRAHGSGYGTVDAAKALTAAAAITEAVPSSSASSAGQAAPTAPAAHSGPIPRNVRDTLIKDAIIAGLVFLLLLGLIFGVKAWRRRHARSARLAEVRAAAQIPVRKQVVAKKPSPAKTKAAKAKAGKSKAGKGAARKGASVGGRVPAAAGAAAVGAAAATAAEAAEPQLEPAGFIAAPLGPAAGPGSSGFTGSASGFTGSAAGFTGSAAGFTGSAAGFTGSSSGFTGSSSGFTGSAASGFTGSAAGFTGSAAGFTGSAASGFTGSASSGSPAANPSSPGFPAAGTSSPGFLAAGTSSSGYPAADSSSPGFPAADSPSQGFSASDHSSPGSPAADPSAPELPAAGTSSPALGAAGPSPAGAGSPTAPDSAPVPSAPATSPGSVVPPTDLSSLAGPGTSTPPWARMQSNPPGPARDGTGAAIPGGATAGGAFASAPPPAPTGQAGRRPEPTGGTTGDAAGVSRTGTWLTQGPRQPRPLVSGRPPWEPAPEPDSELPWVQAPVPRGGADALARPEQARPEGHSWDELAQTAWPGGPNAAAPYPPVPSPTEPNGRPAGLAAPGRAAPTAGLVPPRPDSPQQARPPADRLARRWSPGAAAEPFRAGRAEPVAAGNTYEPSADSSGGPAALSEGSAGATGAAAASQPGVSPTRRPSLALPRRIGSSAARRMGGGGHAAGSADAGLTGAGSVGGFASAGSAGPESSDPGSGGTNWPGAGTSQPPFPPAPRPATDPSRPGVGQPEKRPFPRAIKPPTDPAALAARAPDADQPGAGAPGTGEPGAGQPGAGQPGAGQGRPDAPWADRLAARAGPANASQPEADTIPPVAKPPVDRLPKTGIPPWEITDSFPSVPSAEASGTMPSDPTAMQPDPGFAAPAQLGAPRQSTGPAVPADSTEGFPVEDPRAARTAFPPVNPGDTTESFPAVRPRADLEDAFRLFPPVRDSDNHPPAADTENPPAADGQD